LNSEFDPCQEFSLGWNACLPSRRVIGWRIVEKCPRTPLLDNFRVADHPSKAAGLLPFDVPNWSDAMNEDSG
jgi:hypothetical protein